MPRMRAVWDETRAAHRTALFTRRITNTSPAAPRVALTLRSRRGGDPQVHIASIGPTGIPEAPRPLGTGSDYAHPDSHTHVLSGIQRKVVSRVAGSEWVRNLE